MAVEDSIESLSASLHHLVPAFTAVASLWLGWRLWAFTLWPALHPEAPKPLPYLVPILGHVFGMSKNAARLYTRGREFFGNTREVFSVTVMGEVLYIVTSPSDVQLMYKEPKLSFEAVISAIMGDFGCNADTVHKMFDKEGKIKNWMDVSHDDFKLQMHPGEKFEALNASFLRNIESWMHWDRITGFPLISQSSSARSKTVSLWKWCYTVLCDSATRSMFGDAIFEAYPDMLENFYAFDEEGWKLPFKYPHFAAKRLYSTLERSKTAFADYLALPMEKRQDSSWIVKRLEEGMAEVGITDPAQSGVMLLVLHRLTNSNAYRLIFWCLAHLLHDEALLSLIREEIRPAFASSPGAKPDMAHLLDRCPNLASFYDEVLRLSVDPIAVRVTTDEVTLGVGGKGKVLRPGRRILAPFRQMHFDPQVWGPADVGVLAPRRFADNPKLQRSTSWRPFGGGNTHCPGRFIARREVYMFLAIALFRFDVRLAPGVGGGKQKFPVLDTSIPLGGIFAPLPGDDVVLEIQPLESVDTRA